MTQEDRKRCVSPVNHKHKWFIDSAWTINRHVCLHLTCKQHLTCTRSPFSLSFADSKRWAILFGNRPALGNRAEQRARAIPVCQKKHINININRVSQEPQYKVKPQMCQCMMGGNRLIQRAHAQASMSSLPYREYQSNSGPSVCNGYYCNTVPRILL